MFFPLAIREANKLSRAIGWNGTNRSPSTAAQAYTIPPGSRECSAGAAIGMRIDACMGAS
jgi:hypothetical protein